MAWQRALDVLRTTDHHWLATTRRTGGAPRTRPVDGIAEEYALAAHRYLGDDAGPYLAQFDAVGMARIVVRPRWVGLLDFDARLPGPLGGVG